MGLPRKERGSKGTLIEGKAGIALIAEKAGVPIVPVGIAGTESVNRKWLRFQRPWVAVRFGRAFKLPAIDRNDRAGWLKRNTDEIMCQIAGLLPPVYRGFYARHPRLAEILTTNN